MKYVFEKYEDITFPKDKDGHYIVNDPDMFDAVYKTFVIDRRHSNGIKISKERKVFVNLMVYSFICKKCGKRVTRSFRWAHIENHKTLLCQDCLNISRYGYAHTYENKEKQRYALTRVLEEHGAYGMACDETRAKIESSNLIKFGSTCSLKNPKVNIKARKTTKEKFGVDYALQNKEILQATKTAMINKYGEVSPLKISKFKLKAENTTMKNYGVKNIFLSSDFHKESDKKKLDKYGNKNNYKQAVKTRILRYGRNLNNTRYNYYGINFDSSWELAVWIYCIDNDVSIIRNPCVLEYTDNIGKVHNYEVDFMINGKLVEIKGDQYFNQNGTMKCCHNIEKIGNIFVELTSERKKYKDDLAERKHKCGLANGVEFWREKDCLKYITYCNTKYPGWNILYRKDNPYNPSYWCGFIFNPGHYQRLMYYLLSNRGITPFDCNNSQYAEITGPGLTPFDIKS